MSDDEYDSPEALQATGNPGPGSGRQHTPNHRKGPRFSWTPPFEATFFRSLCESVKIGLKDNHSFKSEAWDRACTALAERHGAYPNKGHLINKSDNARKKFRLWRGLREDPEFLYNPNTKIVTASDEAWRAHIEREPLSKSLRNRPFEHEAYMEILFPDVIGSGGAPKRITKPRRKGLDLPDSEDLDTPGTNVMNLLSPSTSQALFAPTSQTPIHPPTVPSNGTIRPSSTTIPSRTSIASSSALTPPDEEVPPATHSRKRFLPSNNTSGPGEKRRRTAAASHNNANNNYIDLTHTSQLLNLDNQPQPDGLNGMSSSNPNSRAGGQPSGNANPSVGGGNPAGPSRNQIIGDGMLALSELARAARNAPPPPPRWTEQALEYLFRDFAHEDFDLQIKIGEKVLTDPNKAMMFCLMPVELRKHYVGRLRELHNRLDAGGGGSGGGGMAGGLNGASNNNNNPINNSSSNTMLTGAGMMGVMGGPINGGNVSGGLGRTGSQAG